MVFCVTNIKSDDTDDQLTVSTAPDGDMWIGINSFHLVRFRNMIGGGMFPHTFVALRNLEEAMIKDKEAIENGRQYHLEWNAALQELNSIKDQNKAEDLEED